jgi:DNA invertase Pin-like site-specific DNA recombinase
LLDLIATQGWELIHVYTDRASGSKDNRPGLAELMACARRGVFDVVVIWRFDRLSRSVRSFLTLVDGFVRLMSIWSHTASPSTPTTPMGKFTPDDVRSFGRARA